MVTPRFLISPRKLGFNIMPRRRQKFLQRSGAGRGGRGRGRGGGRGDGAGAVFATSQVRSRPLLIGRGWLMGSQPSTPLTPSPLPPHPYPGALALSTIRMTWLSRRLTPPGRSAPLPPCCPSFPSPAAAAVARQLSQRHVLAAEALLCEELGSGLDSRPECFSVVIMCWLADLRGSGGSVARQVVVGRENS